MAIDSAIKATPSSDENEMKISIVEEVEMFAIQHTHNSMLTMCATSSIAIIRQQNFKPWQCKLKWKIRATIHDDVVHVGDDFFI